DIHRGAGGNLRGLGDVRCGVTFYTGLRLLNLHDDMRWKHDAYGVTVVDRDKRLSTVLQHASIVADGVTWYNYLFTRNRIHENVIGPVRVDVGHRFLYDVCRL